MKFHNALNKRYEGVDNSLFCYYNKKKNRYSEDFKLADEQRHLDLCEWIANSIRPSRHVNRKHTSLELARMASVDLNLDVGNADLKRAMYASGYGRGSKRKAFWHYRISNDSPAFKRSYPWHETDLINMLDRVCNDLERIADELAAEE